MDTEGHLAYQGGKPLPGLCHCARDEAHDAEPTAPAPPEAYGWQQPVDGPVTVECWGAGGSGEVTAGGMAVRYRRKDGTEATGQLEPDDHGGLSWLAPEDCAAIIEIMETGGGGRSSTSGGVTVSPGETCRFPYG